MNEIDYSLPTSVDIGGKEYDIRSDFRAVLDIFSALTDIDLTESERGLAALTIFYPDFDKIPRDEMEEASLKMVAFLSCGENEEQDSRKPKLIDWRQDFRHIIAPVNRVAGRELRSEPFVHWWTFLSYFNEIGGDCFFAEIVRIRNKKARGKKLDKEEQRFYKENRAEIDLKRPMTEAEEDTLKRWLNG